MLEKPEVYVLSFVDQDDIVSPSFENKIDRLVVQCDYETD
jgi:hypothetical protein